LCTFVGQNCKHLIIMHGMENIKIEGIFVEKVIGFATKKVHSSDIVLLLKCFDDISDSPKHIVIVITWLI